MPIELAVPPASWSVRWWRLCRVTPTGRNERKKEKIVHRHLAPLTALGLIIAVASTAPAETIYVSNEKDNSISVIDGDSLQVIATVPVGQRPRGILLSRDKTKLYICASDDEFITEVRNTVVHEIAHHFGIDDESLEEMGV